MKRPTPLVPPEVIEDLREIFERCDVECYYRARNREHQGQWRNVKLLAQRALRACKAPVPQTMSQKDKARRKVEPSACGPDDIPFTP